MICNTEKGGNCKVPGVVYQIQCNKCKDTYYGESHRNGNSRCREHLNSYRSKNPKQQEESVMKRHEGEKHEGEKVEFSMKIIQSFQNDALGRQIMAEVE